MLFFINPVTDIVENFSQEKALLRAYLGLTESMPQSITNSVVEFRAYYNRFLGYLIYNLENAIDEIEASQQQEDKSESLPQEKTSTVSEQKTENALVEAPKIQADEVPASENILDSQKPEIVNIEAVEAVEEEEDWPVSDNVDSADKNPTQPEFQNYSSFYSERKTDGVESVETKSTLQKLEVVSTEAVEPLEQEENSSPKFPNGSHTGSLPDSSQLKPNVADITDEVIQLELLEPLHIPGGAIAVGTVYDEPAEIEATTPLLEAVKTELIKINNTLEYKTCKYNPEGSTFLEIYHGESHLGFFEDDGDCLWDSVEKLKHHGFSQEQLYAISEIELPKV